MAEGTQPPPPDPEPNPFLHPEEPNAPADAPPGLHDPARAAVPARRKRRRRIWPKVIIGLLVLVVLLVLFAPTLLSTPPVRAFVVGKINQNLNGRVQIDRWSLGWHSPVTISGLKLFDRAGSQIVELPRLTTELTLLDAVRGNFRVGKVTVDGLDLLVRRDAQGNINLADLAKQSNAEPQATSGGGGGSKASSAREPTKLPDVSGELHLVNCRATFEDQAQGQTFHFPSIAGVVKVPDINQPIETMLDVACKVGDSPAGKISLAGKADVADGNVLRVDRADVDEKLTIQGVDLGSLAFLLGKDASIQKLSGMTAGTLALRYKGGESATAEGSITSSGFALGGPALKGDTFSTQKLSLVLPPTTLNIAGSDDPKAWALRVGTGGTDAITLAIDQGRVELASDARVQSLLNLAQNQPPGSAGRVRANVDLNVGALAQQMPNTFALQEGLTLESGRLTHIADVELAADRAVVRRLETHLTDVRGRNARGPVSLQPIDLTFTAASFGGGFAAPDVRDLALDLKSGFANAQFTGKDVSQLAGSATGDLKQLQDELGQVVDIGAMQLAGPFTVRIDSKGDVVAGGNSALHATATVNDLVVEGLKDTAPIREKRLLLDLSGDVVRAADGSVGSLRGLKLALNAGEPNQPTVDAQFNGSVDLRKNTASAAAATVPPGSKPPTTASSGVAAATVDQIKLVVDLPRAKAELGPLVPALKDYGFERGTLTVGGRATYDGAVVATDTQIMLANLTLREGPTQAEVLKDETLRVESRTRGPADFTTHTIEAANILGSVVTARIDAMALQLKVGQGAAARSAGALEMIQTATVSADVPDLAKLQALAEAFSSPQAPAPAAQRATEPVRGSNVISRPRQPAARAAETAKADAGAAAAPPPLKWGGAVNVKLAVARQGDRVVATPTVTGRNVTVARGASSESLGDVKLETALSYVPVAPAAAPKPAAAAAAATAPAPAPPLTEQLRDLQVPTLSASVAGSTVTLAEPVAISDVAGLQRLLASISDPAANAGGPAPASVKTALRAQGDVGKLLAVAKVLQASDSPAAYAGTYALEQRLAGDKDGLAFSGTVNVDNFAVRDEGGKPQSPGGFAEKAIRLANDVRLDAAKHALAIKNVSLDMETTKALQLKLSGNVLDLSTQRRLDNVQGTLGYDWAKLWDIVRPMLSKEQQENLKVRVAGQAQRSFGLGGSYPAVGVDGKPLAFNQAVKFLTAHFEGGFDVVEVNGLTIEKLELPLTLRDGLLAVAYTDRPAGKNLPAAASCNGGKLDVGGATVVLTEDVPRLNLPKGLKVLQGVTFNPIFSDMFGGMINNPLFMGPSEARGLVDLTVVQCDRLPLDTLVLKNAPQNDGRAEFVFTIQDMYLGNSALLEGLKGIRQATFAKSMQGDIRESRVIIQRGQTRQDIVFNIGEKDRPLRMQGSTKLETKDIDMVVTLPPQLLRQVFGEQALKVFPEGFPLTLKGKASPLEVDLERAFTDAIANAPQDVVGGILGGALQRATKDKSKKDRPAATQPARGAQRGTNPDKPDKPGDAKPEEPDPLKDLLDLIGKKIDEKEQPKDRNKRQRDRN